jgi:hypothetical protein
MLELQPVDLGCGGDTVQPIAVGKGCDLVQAGSEERVLR